MQAIEKAKANSRDVLWVARFRKDGSLCISRPCRYCMTHIRRAGIKRIHYVDSDGNWVKEILNY
jgi:deoxycytidylate deaminase